MKCNKYFFSAEVKHETEDVKEPRKAMRPPVGAMGGLNSEMLSQLKKHQQKRQSTVINIYCCNCNGSKKNFI